MVEKDKRLKSIRREIMTRLILGVRLARSDGIQGGGGKNLDAE